MATTPREGSLEAPTRHPLGQNNPDFYNEDKLYEELERVYDICHGCRRCVSLCNSFPTLFDLVDESDTMEVDGVAKKDFWKVVEHCYLCDLCYLVKCPYVPPHEWDVDFPHLMLRAKAIAFKKGQVKLRDKIITSTDKIGKLASIPIVVNVVNAINKNEHTRALLEDSLGIHHDAKLPEYHSKTLSKRTANHKTDLSQVQSTKKTTGKVAIFGTCYGEYNEPHLGEDLLKVFEHNGIPIMVIPNTQCCGMPKLELGDLDAVDVLKSHNIPLMAQLVDEGWDIISPVPSCTLQFKQELPLMYPEDRQVIKVQQAMFDPFEYLMLRHKENLLNIDFKNSPGKVTYHVACHQRVQKIGLKTKELLALIEGTEISVIERCSGHDGTYTFKKEFHDTAMKICRPVVNRVKKDEPDVYTSDCPMAGHHISAGLDDGSDSVHPITLLKQAYGL
ncbi:MAG: Fe-S oxidoreductase [Gammaproteobacteria bacterium]|jgi:Fe-S oxidoreductase|nr:Fe-S oxidoreductase [Gammaproteobacteria bacterium]MBT3724975.1 Fe-S oxidoreductase [Gammaproteobacteria bacterium]MBT4077923.1 Fe-S oxidoreductase [Gammaproteobacteria bacterium]MBT4192772.1 Fe-S oxidoreductase [Gammaproteobacteria bacterium]MBT4451912.1 Fe-S oxidoreductase [Gammaproteobacteria bacterium]